jgi:hypothetical protein
MDVTSQDGLLIKGKSLNAPVSNKKHESDCFSFHPG